MFSTLFFDNTSKSNRYSVFVLHSFHYGTINMCMFFFSFLDAWYKFRQLRCSDFFFFSTNLMKSTHFFLSPPNMNCSHFCTQIHQILSTIKMLHFRNSCILKITFVLKVLPVVIVGMSIAIVAISYCWCHCYHSYVH